MHVRNEGGRLPDGAYAERRWRIHEIAADFDLEDVWELPVRCEEGDFARFVDVLAGEDPGANGPWPARALWALRWKLGELLGWDDDDAGLGSRTASLRERLPQDLRDTDVPDFDRLPFEPLYLTDDEFAAEIANATMHGVLHLGRVARDDGSFGVQMAVLVKPNGVRGRAYMALIRPFRHLIVYPAMMREIERRAARELAAG